MTRERAIKEIGYKLGEVRDLWDEMIEIMQYIPEIKSTGVFHNVFGGQEYVKDELSELLDEQGYRWLMEAYRKRSIFV
ncbi:hypothetical protein [uncultured Helicobacter sp.]|uniref:hypothetical protein n=1 Tax=uncultured Helicobacter sp. TaxID=175537 RepID=UPI00374E7C8D